MNRIAIYLNKIIDGVVYSAPGILDHYSTDRSLLKIHPRVVAVPENTMDIRRLVRYSYQLSQKNVSFPITVRGAGYGKNGSALGSGLVISTERMNAVQELDVRQRLVRVQCGVKLGELKKALQLCGLDLPVFGDPNETIGGLIAKAASASDNTKPSTILSFIDRAEVVLANGDLAELSNITPRRASKKCAEDSFEGEIYRKIAALAEEKEEGIAQIANRRGDRSGYSGICNVKTNHSFSLLPLLCGSEGSLGVITEVILKVEPVFDEPNRIAIPCRTATAFVDVCNALKTVGFTDIVFYDTELFNEVDNTGKTSRFFRKASDNGILVVASVKDDSTRARRKKMKKIHRVLSGTTRIIEEDDENFRDFLALENTLNAYLNDNATYTFHLPLIDGAFIPPEKQVDFLHGIDKIGEAMKIRTAVFGSADFNTFSVRPSFTLNTVDGRKAIIKFLLLYLKLIADCDGYPCGSAPEGRLMAVFAKKYEDKEVAELYSRIKEIFDKQGILNPGIKQDANVKTTFQHFRTDYNGGVISSK